MGSRDKRRPPQDCIKIQIQSHPRRGFYPRSTANTRHSRRRAISKESKGAKIIGGHGQSGDDKAATVSTTTAGDSTANKLGKTLYYHRDDSTP